MAAESDVIKELKVFIDEKVSRSRVQRIYYVTYAGFFN